MSLSSWAQRRPHNNSKTPCALRPVRLRAPTGGPADRRRPLPGHEEENAAYLVSTGAARKVEEGALGKAVAALLYDRPEGLALMAETARLVGRPDSAQAIASHLATIERNAEGVARWRLQGAPPRLAGAYR